MRRWPIDVEYGSQSVCGATARPVVADRCTASTLRMYCGNAWRNIATSRGTGMDEASNTLSDQLRSTGRELELCVARASGDGRDYHDALRSGDSKFYRLARGGQAIGLVQVDADSMCIADAQGPANATVRLTRKRALDLLRVLEATADDAEAFSRVGAFSVFLDGTPKGQPYSYEGCTYRIWAFPDTKRIAVRETFANGRRSTWSLFERRGSRIPERPLGTWVDCCYHNGAMGIGEFTDLLIRCPEIAEYAGQAA